MIPLASITPQLDAPDAGLDALIRLQTLTVDSEAGFEKMVEKAEPSFRAVAEGFRALHARHAAALAGILASRGHNVDGGQSLMGALNEAVVSVRAFFDDIDADLMPSIRRGEDHVLTAFAEVLEHPLSADETALISAMRDELVALMGKSPA